MAESTIANFKLLAKEFCKAAPEASMESLLAGYKCLGVAFLNLEAKDVAESAVAESVLHYVTLRCIERQASLIG